MWAIVPSIAPNPYDKTYRNVNVNGSLRANFQLAMIATNLTYPIMLGTCHGIESP